MIKMDIRVVFTQTTQHNEYGLFKRSDYFKRNLYITTLQMEKQIMDATAKIQ